MRTINFALIFVIFLLFLGACASFSFPYRTDVQQGNIITSDLIEKLQIGMNQREVSYLLGSPLLIDPFHHDRWDYYYSLKSVDSPNEQRRLTLFFKDDNLLRIDNN